MAHTRRFMVALATTAAAATIATLLGATPATALIAADPPGTLVLQNSSGMYSHGLSAGRFYAVNWQQSGLTSYPVSVVNGSVTMGSTTLITESIFDYPGFDGRRAAWGDPVTGNLSVDASGKQSSFPDDASIVWQMTAHRVLFNTYPTGLRIRDLVSGNAISLDDRPSVLSDAGYAYQTASGSLEFKPFATGAVTPVATAAEVGSAYSYLLLAAIGRRILWYTILPDGSSQLRWRDLNSSAVHNVLLPEGHPLWYLSYIQGKYVTFGPNVIDVETNDIVWTAPNNSIVESINGTVALWRDDSTGTSVYKLSPLALGLAPRHEGNPFTPATLSTGGSWTGEWVFDEALTTCSVEFRNMAGSLVRTVACDPAAMGVGEAVVTWDGKDAAAVPVPGGTYAYRVVASDIDGAVTDPNGAPTTIAGSIAVAPPPCGGAATTGRQLNLDVTCDGVADMVTVDSAGQLVFRPGKQEGTFGSPQVIGTGWGGFTAIITPGAQRAGSFPAVWARTPDGRLLSYALTADTNGKVTITYDRLIGTGWGGISAMTPAGDVNGDGNGDLYGRALNGNLNLYYGNGSGIASQMLVGTGWNGLDAIFGGFDITGDSLNDVVGRDRTTGALRKYPASASGALTGSGPIIGTGWGGLNPLTSLSSPQGGNRMVGMLPDGRLQAYPMSSSGSITGPNTIATGWATNRLMW